MIRLEALMEIQKTGRAYPHEVRAMVEEILAGRKTSVLPSGRFVMCSPTLEIDDHALVVAKAKELDIPLYHWINHDNHILRPSFILMVLSLERVHD
jgi:hypothetical protein